MGGMHRLAVVGATIVAATLCRMAVAADGDQPVAKVEAVTDTLYGTPVIDRYRWMEREGPDFVAWMRAEDAYTRSILHEIPGRAALLKQLATLSATGDQVSNATFDGERWFYTMTRAGEDVAKLYVRGSDGNDRVIVNPHDFDKGGAHAIINYWKPSWDGRYVAFGVSVGGAEIGVLHVVEVESGRLLSDAIDRTYYASPAWLPDNSGFFYSRGVSGNAAARLADIRLYLHRLGASPDSDQVQLGAGVGGVDIPEGRFPTIVTSPNSKYALLSIDAGLPNDDVVLYAAPLSTVQGPRTPWRRISQESDHVRAFAFHGDDLYVTVAKDAPHLKVVRTSLARPDLDGGETLVPEGDGTIADIQSASDGLYLHEVVGGPSRILHIGWKGGVADEVPLPKGTGVKPDDFATFDSASGVVVIDQSWTRSPAILRFDPSTDTMGDTGLQPPSHVDFSDIEVVETSATASDGTRIPLSIMFKKGTKLDGSNPALLSGYGAYGDVRIPSFDPMRRAWFDRGGVYAVAHVRGGGEFGEPWHQAGMLANKPNTINDFIACAEYLVARGYTSPHLLAGDGRSAGGVMIAGAVVTRPDLFGAALITVGLDDALRLEKMPTGPFNAGEFGSVASEAGFHDLLAVDAYQHVRDGVAYPAVLLSTGLHDARVSPWQSGKMAARLQAATSSGKPILLRVNEEGGHFGAGTQSDAEEMAADSYSFLLWQAGRPDFQRNGK